MHPITTLSGSGFQVPPPPGFNFPLPGYPPLGFQTPPPTFWAPQSISHSLEVIQEQPWHQLNVINIYSSFLSPLHMFNFIFQKYLDRYCQQNYKMKNNSLVSRELRCTYPMWSSIPEGLRIFFVPTVSGLTFLPILISKSSLLFQFYFQAKPDHQRLPQKNQTY